MTAHPKPGTVLSAEDHAVISRCADRQPALYMRGSHEGYYIHSDVADIIDIIGRLSSRPSLEPPASDELSGISGELPPASDVAGWRIVPVEPTEAMVWAGALAAMEAATEFMDDDFWKDRHLQAIERMKAGDRGSDEEQAKGVAIGSILYRAMLAAAPPHPASKEP